MRALQLAVSEFAQWRASMRLLLAEVYGRTFPYQVVSQVGGITVTSHVTRHVVPFRHAALPDTLLPEVSPMFEAALNNDTALEELPPPHRARLEGYRDSIIDSPPEDVGEDYESA